MQDNAVVIFTEPCSNQDGKSFCSPIPNEVALWNPVTHIHKLYYRHTKANTIVNDGDKGTAVLESSYPVDLPTMDRLVDQALTLASFSDVAKDIPVLKEAAMPVPAGSAASGHAKSGGLCAASAGSNKECCGYTGWI